MAKLPCHDERGCDAFCCRNLWIYWDCWSYNFLLRTFPGILEEYNATSVRIVGEKDYFLIFPRDFPHIFPKGEIKEYDWEYLKYEFEKGFKTPACVFLDEERRCSIYAWRPVGCQTYGLDGICLCLDCA